MTAAVPCPRPLPLSDEDARVYGRIARREPLTPDDQQHADRLADWGLVACDPDQPDQPVALHPQDVLRRHAATRMQEAMRLLTEAVSMPMLSDQLAGHYDAGRWGIPGGSEFLDDPSVVNARLSAVVAAARSEVLISQPGGPRSRDKLEVSIGRDTAALERGVRLRTMYRDTVRDDPITAEYAATMTGLGAQYRTVNLPFQRCILVDREHAFISNYVVPDAPEHAAWHVTCRASVAWMVKAWGHEWARANPWCGELRSRRGDGQTVGVSTDGAGLRTTARERDILRLIADDHTQTVIAKKLGCSPRKLRNELADLKDKFGVGSVPALMCRWMSSPDRLVDDNAPTGTAGAEADGAGVRAA